MKILAATIGALSVIAMSPLCAEQKMKTLDDVRAVAPAL